MKYMACMMCMLLIGCQTHIYNRSVVRYTEQKAETLGAITNLDDSESNDSVSAPKSNELKNNSTKDGEAK